MGKSIKGHMTRVDRLYARLLYGQFVHSAWNKCIQVFDYLTDLTSETTLTCETKGHFLVAISACVSCHFRPPELNLSCYVPQGPLDNS